MWMKMSHFNMPPPKQVHVFTVYHSVTHIVFVRSSFALMHFHTLQLKPVSNVCVVSSKVYMYLMNIM